MKVQTILATSWILSSIFFLAGCGGGGSGGGGGNNPNGNGTLTVQMADAPDPTITAFNLTIDRVEANVNGTWETVSTATQTYNLLTLDKVPTNLGSANLPAGAYTQVRLFPTAATVTDSTGTHNVKIP